MKKFNTLLTFPIVSLCFVPVLSASNIEPDTYLTSGIVECSDNGAGCQGYWIRGQKHVSGKNQLVSEYKDYVGQGRASVVNGNGDTDDGGWKATNTYSYASEDWTFWGTNKAYYDYK